MTIRLDPYTCCYPQYVSPGVYAATGSVFRGFKDEEQAKRYADTVAEFFAQNALDQPVYVVRGPTSTTRQPFEVLAACCGYTIVYTVRSKK